MSLPEQPANFAFTPDTIEKTPDIVTMQMLHTHVMQLPKIDTIRPETSKRTLKCTL